MFSTSVIGSGFSGNYGLLNPMVEIVSFLLNASANMAMLSPEKSFPRNMLGRKAIGDFAAESTA